MSKFKIGDNVICIAETGFVFEGATGIVTHLVNGNNKTVCVKWDSPQKRDSSFYNPDWWINDDEIALYNINEDFKSSLDNGLKGLKSLKELLEKNKLGWEGKLLNSGKLYDILQGLHYIENKLCVYEKPKFQEFTVQTWAVKLKNEKLHIGCKSFSVARIKEILKCHLNDEGNTSDEYVYTTTMRHGIKFKFSPSEQYTLNWDSAEKIYIAIKELK